MTWRTAKCLDVLLAQVNAACPDRKKDWDGTLGDQAHAARDSEHNPDEHGVVRAMDITHDPAHGFDSYAFADYLRTHWDDRVQYVISNSRIANIDVGAKAWRAYNGENPHDHHIHITVRADDRADEDRQWEIAPFFGAASLPAAPPVPFVPLDQRTIDAITAVAAASDLVHYSWNGRGPAPRGFINGVAITFATMLRKLAARDSAARAMVRIVNGKPDVFDHYEEMLTAASMVTRGAPDVDRLRILFVILIGLAGRESSFGVDIGRDKKANNTTADTAEAGTWQQSRDSFAASGDPELPKLFAAYVGSAPDAVDAIFKHGITPLAGALENFGDPDSDGYKFQALVKARPSIGALFAAIAMRTAYSHWGPLISHAAEIVPAADALFRQVQEIVGSTTQRPVPMPDPAVPQPQPQPSLPALHLPQLDVLQGLQYIVTGQRDKVRADLKMFLDVFNAKHTDIPIALPPAPATAPPVTTPLHQTPAFQLGGAGLLLTGILHQLHVIDPNMAILAAIVSAGAAFLGPAGGIVGTIVMNLAKAAWNSVPTPPK